MCIWYVYLRLCILSSSDEVETGTAAYTDVTKWADAIWLRLMEQLQNINVREPSQDIWEHSNLLSKRTEEWAKERKKCHSMTLVKKLSMGV